METHPKISKYELWMKYFKGEYYLPIVNIKHNVQIFFLRTNKIWLMKKYRGIQMHNFPKSFDCHCTSREKHLLLFQSGQTGQYVNLLVLNINISEEKQTLPLWKEISENQCIFQFSTYIQFSVKIYHYKVAKMPFGPCLAQNLRASLCTNSFHIILWYNSQQK